MFVCDFSFSDYFLIWILQEWCKCKRVFRVVTLRQFWMGRWLHHAIWNTLCWLQKWLEKIPKAFCFMVQGFSQNRNQTSWFHVIKLLFKNLSQFYIVNMQLLGYCFILGGISYEVVFFYFYQLWVVILINVLSNL